MGLTLAGGAVAVAYGVTRMNRFVKDKPERRPILALFGAAIFLVSLIPFPAFPGTCSHPCGTPLAAILLGPGITFVLAALGLLLQAAFFAHGGFSSLGANTLTLGVAGGFVGWATYFIARKAGASRLVAGFIAGLLGDVLTYVAAGFILGAHLAWVVPHPKYDLASYLKIIYLAYLPVQGPIALAEAFVTGLAMHSIGRQRPEVLEDLGIEKKGFAKAAVASALLLLILLPALGRAAEALTATASPATAPTPWSTPVTAGFSGLDEKVNEAMAESGGSPARDPYIDLEHSGDLWNFVLLAGGGIAGFIVGLNFHHVFGPKRGDPPSSSAKG
jgi:cobalt/nickel transport system permease protein